MAVWDDVGVFRSEKAYIDLSRKYDIKFLDWISTQIRERSLEESILAITEEIRTRLSTLQASENFDSPPKILRKRKGKTQPKSVLIGKATREQQALAVLYCQVYAVHKKMHKVANMPFGVNPHVESDHYRNHVMIPILFQMLTWSVHRAFPKQKTTLQIRFDPEWNMYAPRVHRDRKKTKTKS